MQQNHKWSFSCSNVVQGDTINGWKLVLNIDLTAKVKN